MQEPHEKGVANHLDPESCAGVGNSAGEALTENSGDTMLIPGIRIDLVGHSG
jgi:hypothetical protein